jgi:hypothetical protein
MGFSPRQIDAMSLFEFNACLEGWRAAHSAEGGRRAAGQGLPEETLADMEIEGFD